MAVTAECIVNDSALHVTARFKRLAAVKAVTGHLLDVCKTDRVNVWRNLTVTGRHPVSFLVERMLCFASETLSSVRCVAQHVGRYLISDMIVHCQVRQTFAFECCESSSVW